MEGLENSMSDVVVIGGGPAGMMAAFAAAKQGSKVTLLEKNEKLGKKLYITGKGRCNLTNGAEISDFFPQIRKNRKFLYSAFYGFTNRDLMDFFEGRGIALKIERGNRVFPRSDHSSDIIRGMEGALRENGVEIRLNRRAVELLCEEGRIKGVRTDDGEVRKTDAVILAAGGKSYPATGSDGTGYALAERLGHTVSPLYPSLVPLILKETFPRELAGLSLKNVELLAYDGKKKLFSEFGELLFTHTGISGPIALTASTTLTEALSDGRILSLSLDLKPALSPEKLHERIVREVNASPNQELKTMMPRLLPKSLGEVLMREAKLPPEIRLNSLTKEMRGQLVRYLKAFPMTAIDTAGFREAIITRGGIRASEIHPGTMESKLVRGLYFAGEMIDCDAVTGGYNLQIAWSTGYLAGESAGKGEERSQI